MAVLSIGVVSCKKEEGRVNNNTLVGSTKNTMREEEFTRSFEPIEGGDKADCSAKGKSCKIKAIMDEQALNEMSLLNTLISSGNGNDYFTTPNWEYLFAEINSQQGLLHDILTNVVHIYKFEHVATNNVMYCLSTAQTQTGVTAANTVAGWNF
jgi:hypothetical protein